MNNGEARILPFPMHWKGGAHMQFEMKQPLFGREQRTTSGDVEIIHPTAARRTDAGIEIKGRTLAFQKDKGRSCTQPVGRRPRTDAAATTSGPRPGDPPTETAFQPLRAGERNYHLPGEKQTPGKPTNGILVCLGNRGCACGLTQRRQIPRAPSCASQTRYRGVHS